MRTALETLIGRAHRANLPTADGLLVGLVTAVALGALIYRTIEGPEIAPGAMRLDLANALAVVLILAAIVSLIWRRPNVMAIVAVSAGAFVAADLSGTASPLLAFAPLIALYAVAVNYRPTASAASAALLGVVALAVFVANPGPLDDDFIDYLLSIATAWLLGFGVRLSRVRAALLADQAQQLRREQAARTEAAIRDEQSRIARELHDIVADRVVLIIAQAAAAGRTIRAECEHAAYTLSSIEGLGREALTEMRRLLGVLSPSESAPNSPRPGLDDVPVLVAQVEQAGIPIRFTVRGEPTTLPAGVQLSAYRIVQEALTNTLKHAGPARADVELAYHPDFLELRIRDDGRGVTHAPTPGHGLLGMRQRVAMLGGELTAGSGANGGFEVCARIQVNGARA